MSREQERRDAWTQARHSEMEGRRPRGALTPMTLCSGGCTNSRPPSENWTCKRSGNVKLKQCEICGQPFLPRTGPQKICTNPECKAAKEQIIKERRRARKRAKNKVRGVIGKRTCIICGETYQPYQRNQEICGDKNCRLSLKRKRAKEQKQYVVYEKRTCIICGKTYQPTVSVQKTCSEECRQHRAKQLQNKRRGHAAPEFSGSTYRPRVSPDPLYGHGHRWCGVPVESTSFAPLG